MTAAADAEVVGVAAAEVVAETDAAGATLTATPPLLEEYLGLRR